MIRNRNHNRRNLHQQQEEYNNDRDQRRDHPQRLSNFIARCRRLMRLGNWLLNIRFLVVSLVLSVFKFNNMITFLHRLVTIAMVIAHYTYVEGIDYWNKALRG
jgi:hypothetical protein